MIRAVSFWVESLFVILIAVLFGSTAGEQIYTFVRDSQAVQDIGWVSQSNVIFEVTFEYGIWIALAGLFLVALQYVHRRSRSVGVETRRRR